MRRGGEDVRFAEQKRLFENTAAVLNDGRKPAHEDRVKGAKFLPMRLGSGRRGKGGGLVG